MYCSKTVTVMGDCSVTKRHSYTDTEAANKEIIYTMIIYTFNRSFYHAKGMQLAGCLFIAVSMALLL